MRGRWVAEVFIELHGGRTLVAGGSSEVLNLHHNQPPLDMLKSIDHWMGPQDAAHWLRSHDSSPEACAPLRAALSAKSKLPSGTPRLTRQAWHLEQQICAASV